MLTGNEALIRALTAARIKSVWSFPGSPLTRVEMMLDKVSAEGKQLRHRYTVNEHVASSLSLAGALLSGHGTAVLMKHVGINVALDTLATFGVVNELRSPSLIIEGVDPVPATSQNAQDNRAVLATVAHLAQLETGGPDEVYFFTRLAAAASRKTGMPIVVRTGSRALEAKGEVHETPPDLPDGSLGFARGAGPYICTATTYRYHTDKRRRRLRQLGALVEALAVRQGKEGDKGVVLAGTLGATAQARAWARRLPSLRLASSWPLPEHALLDLMRGCQEVLVLEEGEPFLEREIQALAHREQVDCRVRGSGGALPHKLDDESIEAILADYGGRLRAETEPMVRDTATWKTAADLVAAIGEDDAEPWPLYAARARERMKRFSESDPRRALLGALRALERPTIIVSDPGTTGVLGLRDKLADVKMHMGSAAPIAGGLSEASEVEEQAGSPLVVALIGDTNHYHSELLGVIDNGVARRDVLHVLVVNRRSEMTAGVKTPYLPDDALEAQLRSAGLQVATAMLDDPSLGAAVTYSASLKGPRALICYASPGGPEVQSDG